MLLAVAEQMNIESKLIPRIATGFCGGLSHTAGMCGAVSGGVLALGLSMGRNLPNEGNDDCYQAVQEFMRKFSTQFGSLNCMDLTGAHLGTEEGQKLFYEKGQIKACTDYVGEATRMVLEIIPGDN